MVINAVICPRFLKCILEAVARRRRRRGQGRGGGGGLRFGSLPVTWGEDVSSAKLAAAPRRPIKVIDYLTSGRAAKKNKKKTPVACHG